MLSLLWRHSGPDSVSNHQPHDCLLNRPSRHRSKKTSKLRVTGLCAGNSPGTGEFPAQMASNAENVSIWWRHHDEIAKYTFCAAKHTKWTKTVTGCHKAFSLKPWCGIFTHNLQGCFTCIGTIIWLRHCQICTPAWNGVKLTNNKTWQNKT